MRNESQRVFYWTQHQGECVAKQGSVTKNVQIRENTHLSSRRRACSFWRRSTDTTLKLLNLEVALHETFVLIWLQRKRAPERWFWLQERADGGQQKPRCFFLLQCTQSAVNNPRDNAMCFLFTVLGDSGVVAHVTVATTLPVLDSLYSGQHLPRRRLGRKPSPLKKTHTQTKKTSTD